MNRAIVFGGNHHNGLGVIRALGRMGVRSEVILHETLPIEQCHILKSKYIANYVYVNNCEEGIQHLLKSTEKIDKSEKPIIICTSDGASSAIDLNYDVLREYYNIPGCCMQGRITELMDKEKMALVAEQSGLNVPKTAIAENSKVEGTVIYPCITKPLKSIEGSKSDIRICSNEEELTDVIANSKCHRFQIQKYIEKEFEYQLIGVSVGGVIYIPGRSRIISQPICTNTGFLHYEHLDGSEPLDSCKNFLREINYKGLFSMEFIRGKDGYDYFMEINFRNDGNQISVLDAGCNLPYIWYTHFAGIAYNVNNDIKEIYVMPEFTELNLWYTNKISLRRFIQEMRIAHSFMDYAKDDPAPTDGKKKFLKDLMYSLIMKPLVGLKHQVKRLL